MPLPARCGKLVGLVSSAQILSNYGRDTYVPTSSYRLLVRDDYSDSDDEDNLKPEPGREYEFEVENNKFAFSPG